MIQPTFFTRALVIFGAIFVFFPVLCVQLLMVLWPHSRITKDFIIGRGEDWHNETHFHMSYGAAWADLVVWLPLLVAGSIGVLMGQTWGYALWATSGAISVYINIILWFSERKFVYPPLGPLAYYTIYWGFFMYWGIAVMAYVVLRLAGVQI